MPRNCYCGSSGYSMLPHEYGTGYYCKRKQEGAAMPSVEDGPEIPGHPYWDNTEHDDVARMSKSELMKRYEALRERAQSDEAMAVPMPEDKFMSELKHLINKHSKENGSNTADFVLAQYLVHCLEAFDYAVKYRESTRTLP